MIYEYLSLVCGVIKIFIYKTLNFSKIKLDSIPKMNFSFKIAIKKSSKLILGKNFRCRNNVSFRVYNSGIVSIGKNCFFNDGCSINCQKRVVIGDNVIFGQNVMIFDHDHDYRQNMDKYVTGDVKIGNNVWIGANVIILRGVSIGNNVVVAAGTTVRDDIPDNSVIYQKKEMIINKIK